MEGLKGQKGLQKLAVAIDTYGCCCEKESQLANCNSVSGLVSFPFALELVGQLQDARVFFGRWACSWSLDCVGRWMADGGWIAPFAASSVFSRSFNLRPTAPGCSRKRMFPCFPSSPPSHSLDHVNGYQTAPWTLSTRSIEAWFHSLEERKVGVEVACS